MEESECQGRLSTIRSTLKNVIDIMSVDQTVNLFNSVSTMWASLNVRWPEPRHDFQEGIVNEFKVIQIMLGKRLQFLAPNDPRL